MKTRLGEFVELSVCLTGFGQLQLFGTGMADEYLRVLDEILPAGLVDKLLEAYRRLPAEGRDAAVQGQILGDAELGPVARNIIVLWYSGTWKKLPEDWRAAHGASLRDDNHVVSPEAYLAGLQWAVVGAHPAGGMQTGFASWSAPPEGNER